MATRSMPFWPRPATTSGSLWPGSGLCGPFSGRLSWSGMTRRAPPPHPPERPNSLFHRRLANNPLEDVGRARPSDALHHQKAAIEPGIEEMDEVVLDADQVRVAVPMLNQIFAHTHQRSGAARSQIETAEQLLAGRLHRSQER